MSLYSIYSILFLFLMVDYIIFIQCKDTQNLAIDKIFFRCNILLISSLFGYYG